MRARFSNLFHPPLSSRYKKIRLRRSLDGTWCFYACWYNYLKFCLASIRSHFRKWSSTLIGSTAQWKQIHAMLRYGDVVGNIVEMDPSTSFAWCRSYESASCGTMDPDLAGRFLNVFNIHHTGHMHGVFPVHLGTRECMEVVSGMRCDVVVLRERWKGEIRMHRTINNINVYFRKCLWRLVQTVCSNTTDMMNRDFNAHVESHDLAESYQANGNAWSALTEDRCVAIHLCYKFFVAWHTFCICFGHLDVPHRGTFVPNLRNCTTAFPLRPESHLYYNFRISQVWEWDWHRRSMPAWVSCRSKRRQSWTSSCMLPMTRDIGVLVRGAFSNHVSYLPAFAYKSMTFRALSTKICWHSFPIHVANTTRVQDRLCMLSAANTTKDVPKACSFYRAWKQSAPSSPRTSIRLEDLDLLWRTHFTWLRRHRKFKSCVQKWRWSVPDLKAPTAWATTIDALIFTWCFPESQGYPNTFDVIC